MQSITYFCLGDILYKTSLLNYNLFSNNVRMTLSDCVMGNGLGLLRGSVRSDFEIHISGEDDRVLWLVISGYMLLMESSIVLIFVKPLE